MPQIASRQKRWRYAVWLGMAILIVVALILWKITPKFEETIITDQDTETVRILFIGNSLTFIEHVPAQFVDIAKAQNKDIKLDVKQVAYPDYTLKDHWKRKRAQAAIEGQGWDYVILQGHSAEPVKHPKRLRQYVKLFDEEARDAHAKTILYATWTDPDKLHWHEKIVKIFSDLANDANLILAPVGESMFICQKDYPDIELFKPDKHHATDSGAYLVAATLYTTVFKSKVKVITDDMHYSGMSIDSEIKSKLNKVAAKACEKYHMLDKETKQSSSESQESEQEKIPASNNNPSTPKP